MRGRLWVRPDPFPFHFFPFAFKLLVLLPLCLSILRALVVCPGLYQRSGAAVRSVFSCIPAVGGRKRKEKR
jgi:hypothetical protein